MFVLAPVYQVIGFVMIVFLASSQNKYIFKKKLKTVSYASEDGPLNAFYIFTNNITLKSRMTNFLTFQMVFGENNSVVKKATHPLAWAFLDDKRPRDCKSLNRNIHRYVFLVILNKNTVGINLGATYKYKSILTLDPNLN